MSSYWSVVKNGILYGFIFLVEIIAITMCAKIAHLRQIQNVGGDRCYILLFLDMLHFCSGEKLTGNEWRQLMPLKIDPYNIA